MKTLASLLLVLATACAQPAQQAPESAPNLNIEIPFVGFLPLALQPVDPTFIQHSQYAGMVDCLREQDWKSAAIILHWIRQDIPASDEATALHWFALANLDGEDGALKRAKNHPTAKTAGGQCSIAYSLLHQKRFREAHAAFSIVLKETPQDYLILESAATSAHLAGLNQEASRLLDLRMLLSNPPFGNELELLRAKSLFGAQRWSDAYAQINRILNADSTSEDLWNMAGLCMFQIGLRQQQDSPGAGSDAECYQSFSRAARCFTEASNLSPQTARFQFNLGCSLDWGRDPSAAEIAYARAIELQPGHMNAVGNLVELWNLQNRDDEARKLLNAQLRQPLTPAETERVRALLLGLRQP